MTCFNPFRCDFLLALWIAGFSPFSIPRASAGQTENAATRDYAIALGFEKKGHFPQAAKRWVQFLSDHGKDERIPSAQYHLGICYYQQQDFPKAAEAFQIVLSKHKEFARLDAAEFNLALVRYQQALAASKPEEFQKAAAAFSDMAKHHPKSPQAPQAGWYHAECRYQAGDKPAAVKAYLEVIKTHNQSPLLPELYLALGTTQDEIEEYQEAEKTFQKFLSQFGSHPKAPEAKLRLGLAAMKLEKLADAERYFREAAAQKDFPLADFALVQHGQALFRQDQFEQAATIFESLPGKHPESRYLGDALLAAGKSRYRQGKFPEAQRALEKLLAEHKDFPQVAEGAYWLAQSMRSLMRQNEAVKILEAAIAAPTAGDFKPNLEFALLECLADDSEKAKESQNGFVGFAGRYPQHELAADALYRAARAALELGDFAAGQKHATAFLAREKSAEHQLWGDVTFIAGECQLLSEKPNPAQAEKFYRELIAKSPDHSQSPLARVRVGHCLQSVNKPDEAMNWLNQSLPLLKEKPLQAEAYFIIGRAQIGKEQRKPAIGSLQKCRQIDPNWPRGDEVLFALAIELEAEGDLEEAEKQLNELAAKYPESRLQPRCYSRLGQLKFRQEKWDEAASLFRQLVSKFPNDELAPLAQYRLGAAYYQKPDAGAAVKEISTLLAKWPASDAAKEGRFLRGVSYLSLKQFANAANDLKSYLASEPKDAAQKVEAQLSMAQAHAALKNLQEAKTALESLLAESPNAEKADQAYYELAFIYQQLKDANKAVETFQALATKLPKSPLAAEALYRAGELHEQNQRPDDALKSYQAGLSKSPEPEIADLLNYKIGRLHYERKAFAEAVETYKKHLDDFPKSPYRDDVVYLQAESLFALEKFSEAYPLFVQAAGNKKAEYHARAYYRAGQSSTRNKKWDLAETNFQAVVDRFEKFPQRSEARYGLAFALQNQRKFAAARSHYQLVIKETETETAARARFMLGECDFAEQKFAAAWEHYLEAALGYPYEEWKVQGHMQAARCFMQLKMAERVREELQIVIEEFPEHALVKDAQQLLKTLP